MSADSSHHADPNQDPPHNASAPTDDPAREAIAPDSPATEPSADQPDEGADESAAAKARILIGSQRDVAARPKRQRDWIPAVPPESPKREEKEAPAEPPLSEKAPVAPTDTAPTETAPTETAPTETAPTETAPTEIVPTETVPTETVATETVATVAAPTDIVPADVAEKSPETSQDDTSQDTAQRDTSPTEAPAATAERQVPIPSQPAIPVADAAADEMERVSLGPLFPPPNTRGRLSDDMEDEFERAMAEFSPDDAMTAVTTVTSTPELEPESRRTGRVVAVHRDDVFVELGCREQGVVSLKLFDEPPEVDTEIEVVVNRLNSDDGLYELTVPNATVDVSDWSDIAAGMLVDAHITGHNTGGLECEVNHLRGFIPVSQISLYRVDDLEQFLDERFTCLITEANPGRRNLVLSRRAVLEKEQEEARKELLESLAIGDVREGTVRRILDFGAFVDIGGIDGLIHISKLSWARVEHPSEVLEENQAVKVRVDKIDKQTGRIGLSYRDLLENPWDTAAAKYPVNTQITGTVSKLMDFGAFVQLEPGIEGLVHVSELSHKRIWRPSDVVKEGEEVEALVLSVDTEAQRIGLSMKAVSVPEPDKKEAESDEPGAPAKQTLRRKTPLQGGIGRRSGGEQFGLKW